MTVIFGGVLAAALWRPIEDDLRVPVGAGSNGDTKVILGTASGGANFATALPKLTIMSPIRRTLLQARRTYLLGG